MLRVHLIGRICSGYTHRLDFWGRAVELGRLPVFIATQEDVEFTVLYCIFTES